MLKNYFKIAWRNLTKNRSYGFLNIFGLAIGIACAGLIFLWVEDEMTFDNVNTKKDRLYSVNVNLGLGGNLFTMGSTPRLLADALKKEIPGIVNTARVSDEAERSLFSFDNKSLYASGLYADASIFSMFTLHFVQGDAKHAFSQLYSLVITESAAKKFFPQDAALGIAGNVIGKTVRVDNKQNYTIAGVVKDLPENSTLQFEWLAPYQTSAYYAESQNWDGYGPFTYVELDTKTNPAVINKKIRSFITQKQADRKSEIFLFPMKDWRLYNDFANGRQTGGGRIKQVYMLSTIAWILLFIACINFMNLATASSLKRAKEVAVRKVMGVERKGLIFQFMSEALLMSLLATVAAVIIIVLALPAFNMLMQKQLLLHLNSPLHLISLLIITMICGLIAGSYPALYLSSFNPIMVLKGIKLKTGNASVVRKGLVIVQFTVSIVFIISTMIVYQQIQHVKARKLGFNKDNLVEINMQHDFSPVFPLIKEDLFHTGLVENAAVTDHVTIEGGNTDGRFKWTGQQESNQVSVAFRKVSPEFISTAGMKIIEGRDFTSNASYESNNVIITASMEKMMGKETAIGKIIQSPRDNADGAYTNMTVIGVVNDYVYGNMYNGRPGPVLFFCKQAKDKNDWGNYLYVRLKPQAGAEQAIAQIQSIMKKNNPAYPLEYKFVDDQFNKMFSNEMLISKASGIFATLTIIISCLGLFGLATYTAERRIKEIGIRKVLGASVSGLAGLLSKGFLQLVFISCLLAFPVAWWIMHNWLQNYEYRITMNGWVFLLAGIAAILIALVTVSFQAIKAAMANPVKSLKTE